MEAKLGLMEAIVDTERDIKENPEDVTDARLALLREARELVNED
jgi:hypothetical protein